MRKDHDKNIQPFVVNGKMERETAGRRKAVQLAVTHELSAFGQIFTGGVAEGERFIKTIFMNSRISTFCISSALCLANL